MEQGQQMRFTKEELDLFKATFKDNEELLKLLRKVFLPELDANAPIGQNLDLYFTVDVKDLTPEDAKIALIARNTVIGHLEQQLLQINALANMDSKDLEQLSANAKKNSSK